MDTLCFQSVGIIHETTAPYTPQQNGISERKNRVLKEMVNSMLSYSGLSQGFWGEAMFYVIEPNDSVAINSIIESRDAIFDEHRFSFVPRPSQRSLVKGTEDSGGSVVSERVTDEIVQQSELRKSKRHMTSKDFGPEFQLYLIEGTKDEGFKQKSGIDYFDTYDLVVRISTIRLLIAMASIHNLIIHQMDVKTAFLNGELEEEAPKHWHQKFDEVVLYNGYLLNQADKCVYKKFDASGKRVIICLYVDDMLIFSTDQVQVDLTKKFCHQVSTPLDTCEKLMPNRGLAVSQLEYSIVIGCLMYAMICTRPDIAFVVGKLSRYTSNPETQPWQAIQRVLKYLKKTIDYRLASKKQTCITSSTMESEFVTLEAAGKEAEWLKNLLLEILLWVKPIAPISIRCDSAATLAKAYSQMYNGKSRHLGVRHSMIRELITNGVDIFIYDLFVLCVIFMQRNCTKLGRIVGNLVQLGLMASACNSLSKLKDTIWSNPSEEVSSVG
uniref:Zinc finger, CCHC-type n=1 Tax=Tanacetum cinerariifolium TaxID=118510 RepID=A0A699GR22_TANCI|nr:zinc finger, CCHC-type [Tanacetum cinerariifolium]